MLIRPTTAADFSAIAALTNRYISGTSIHFAYQPVTADELQSAWLKHRDTYPFLTAEVDSTFAGYAKAGPWRERAAYQWTPEVGIYIEPAFHGKGLGRALYGALLDDLRTRGFHSAIGGVTLPNDPSTRLHQSLGFTHVGTVREAGFKFNAWHDVAFWQITLQDGSHRPATPNTR